MRTPILSFTLLLSLWLPVQRSQAQEVSVNYKSDTSDFPNPERGFYVPSGTAAGQFVSLETSKLKDQFAGAHRYANARYAVYSTLLMREYTLDVFREKPLSPYFLDAVDKDLASVREAGLKVILRFAYINKTKTGDCPDEYKICPPYGDAPKSIVLEHIAQLKPLLKKYADVIIPRGIDNQVAIKLIVQHIRTKLDERDPTKITTSKSNRYFDDENDDNEFMFENDA